MAMEAGVDTVVGVEAEADVPATEEGEAGKLHLQVESNSSSGKSNPR